MLINSCEFRVRCKLIIERNHQVYNNKLFTLNSWNILGYLHLTMLCEIMYFKLIQTVKQILYLVQLFSQSYGQWL